MLYIIIPVYNRRELTRQCLISLSQQDTQDFSVIVVDDGSSDGTSEMIQQEFPEVVLLRGSGALWWAGSVNLGIRYAMQDCQSNDYILTLNDDLIVKEYYISNLMNACRNFPGAIIGCVETTIENPEVIKSGGIRVDWGTAKVKILNQGKVLKQFPRGTVIDVSRVTGRGTVFPCKVFEEVGLFDEFIIKQCADTELPLLANFKFGYPLKVTYDAVVISQTRGKKDINSKAEYSLADLREYFFGIRSHFNLKNRYWITKRVAPSFPWFLRFLIFDVVRTSVHFLIRLR